MLSVSKHVKLLSTLFSLVNAGEKTFTLQFFHETRIDEIFPVPRFFDLHELQKNRGVFRTRVRNFGKNLQPKIIGLLENFWIGFTEVLPQDSDAKFTIDAKSCQPRNQTLEKILHGFARSEERRVGKECRGEWAGRT